MRAFFSRLHIGSKDKDKDLPAGQKEKVPHLRQWPPAPEEPQRSSSTPISYTNFKPLPSLVSPELSSQLTTRPAPAANDVPSPTRANGATPVPSDKNDIDEKDDDVLHELPRATSPRQEGSEATTGRMSRRTANESVATSNTLTSDSQKKVAFKSTSPIPLDRTISEGASPLPQSAPIKTTLSRFQATHGREPRGSTSSSNAPSSSKTDLPSSNKKPPSTRAISPYMQKQAQSQQSLRSGTPYSQMSQNTSGSRILAAQSWSEVTEEDLVSNLGARERTRQEVLFEIISSEERYVQELAKMKDTFIDPLLHPYSTTVSPLSSTPNLDYDYYRTDSPADSAEHLPPIAARFMSPTPSAKSPTPARDTPSPRQGNREFAPTMDEPYDSDDDEALDDPVGKSSSKKNVVVSQASKHSHPRSPYRGGTSPPTKKTVAGVSVPFPSRSHHSLPPPARQNPMTASTQSLGRQSPVIERERNYSQGQASLTPERKAGAMSPGQRTGVLRKFKKSDVHSTAVLGDSVAPRMLPEDLRICLEVIDNGVFDGHKRLSEALRKRYDDQFPLVRSLADVFVSNADIFHGYQTYVLHLERALEQVDDAMYNSNTKKPKKQESADWAKVSKALQRLEENAAEKGETGLAITLSKPFQRLLKYPLLFQNLLFHTDPSTFEYESTLQMVAEIEGIVRSIEDTKIQKEERDRTRDVFARIEGLDKVKQLAAPKPSRLLLEEKQFNVGPDGSSSLVVKSGPPIAARNIRGKSSFKRLSDVLYSPSSKKDLWLVVFNDVTLQCQRTGTTTMPISTTSQTNSRTTSMPELQGKAKYASTGRRNSHVNPRNLYKFIKVLEWTINKPRDGVVSMDDVARSSTQARVQPRIIPMPDDDEDGGADSDDSDRKSKMSFSYWGADKVTVQKPPVVKARIGATPRRGGHNASYGRESSANAKFGTRLVSDGSSPSPRPASRRTQVTTPTSRRPGPSEDGHQSTRTNSTRPEWNTSTRPPLAATPVPIKRPRQISQTSSATRVNNGVSKGVASPAPSEDSGL